METENAGVAIDLAIVLRDRSSSRVWDGRKGAVYIRGQRGTLRHQQCHNAIRWLFSRHPLDKAYNGAKKDNGV